MKTSTIIFLAFAFFLAHPGNQKQEETELKLSSITKETEPVQIKKEEVRLKRMQILSRDRDEWLSKLIQCESTGNPHAVNPKDLDGTASYGLLQFKPSTFEMFSKKYGIAGELMDGEAQKKIVRAMMDDTSVRWHRQFPACVNKLGLPPRI